MKSRDILILCQLFIYGNYLQQNQSVHKNAHFDLIFWISLLLFRLHWRRSKEMVTWEGCWKIAKRSQGLTANKTILRITQRFASLRRDTLSNMCLRVSGGMYVTGQDASPCFLISLFYIKRLKTFLGMTHSSCSARTEHFRSCWCLSAFANNVS